MTEGINALEQHLVGLEECHDGVGTLSLGIVLLGSIDERTATVAFPKAVDT